jgi:hypothetical protein
MRAKVDATPNRSAPNSTSPITKEDLHQLPEPVQRYLRSVGIVGKRRIRTARQRQTGFFRMKQGGRWLPFSAEQHITTDPPGFVWRANIQFLPLVNLSVTDLFTRGHGELQAKLFSFLKVAGASGPETDQGELLRYLAEIAWFPTAWLSSYLEWESIDSRSAKVTLQLSSLKALAVLHFDDDSRLCNVTAQRYMIDAGRFRLREWSGQFSEYRLIAGMLIPARANVLWRLEAGDFEYFRGQVTEVEYDI